MKEQFNKDMKSQKKQSEILEIKRSIKNTVESHTRRLKQWKTEFQGLKTKQLLRKKPEEFLDK
jgi:hypothetical protein